MITYSCIPGSFSGDSEFFIETAVDGVMVKAVARRGFRSHIVEIVEPFSVVGSAHGNIPLFAVPAYRRSLEGRDLNRDSVELVVSTYRAFSELLKPPVAVLNAYARFRVEYADALACLEASKLRLSVERQANRRRLKKGEIDAKLYQSELTGLKKVCRQAWGAKFDLERQFCMRWFHNSIFGDELILEILEKEYQQKKLR
ncbi:MAG: hypothetical protein HGB00_06955 [Chlorobiaceae bacterium]|nr:hypothetical protein [Chlorobiaceae bacterium]